MRKRTRILAGVVAFVVLVPVAVVVIVATMDWNSAKPWVQQRASAAFGRTVEIQGDLDAVWHWRRSIGGEDRWSPGFRFTAGGVRIGNPDWAKRPQFAELQALDIDLRMLPLLWRRLDIPSVRLVHPSLDLEQRKGGSNNWTFAPADGSAAPAWAVDIGEIEFDAGEVFVADAERALDLHAQITPLDAPIEFGKRVEGDDPSTRREVIQRVGRAAAQRLRDAAEKRAARGAERGEDKKPPPYLFAFKATGSMHGAAVKGNGRFGGVLALRDPKPFPLRADIDIGATEIALTGTITDPTSPDAVDMRLWISGQNLAQLYTITGIGLPNSPPYATVGRLAGRFHPHRSLLRYEDFTARVGGSNLNGTLTYRSGEPRPTLSGEVDSTLLQFKDLGALVGAGSIKDRSARGDNAAQPADRVLPAEPFQIERWKATDSDVHFTGKRVIRDEELPISAVDTRIRMKAGVLTLDPLRFGMAGGNVNASLRVDSNATPPKGTITLGARKLQLRRLFEKAQGLSTSLGQINGDVKLAGSGRSIAEILGSSDGGLTLVMTAGRVSETLMEEAGLNIANVLISKMRGDQLIDIHCAAAALTVKDGIANVDLFVFDTENALIDIKGTISLRDERIDLTLHPHTKGLRIFSLRSPLHAEGSFRHVEVGVDKKALLARGGGAIGLGLVAAPLAALVPLIAPSGDNEQKSCAPLVDELKKTDARKPTAPAPAKKAAKAARR
jgi:AsmA family protein